MPQGDLEPLAGRLPLHGGLERGRLLSIEVNGEPVGAYEGETIAGALLAAGIRTCRITARRGQPRGLYCGIGLCYECVVVVDGRPNTRACLTYVAPGMRVRTQVGRGEPVEPPGPAAPAERPRLADPASPAGQSEQGQAGP